MIHHTMPRESRRRFPLCTLFLISLLHITFARAISPASAEPSPFTFRDTGDTAGLFPHVAGIRGHGAAWGDIDNDGWPDLFVATFHNQGSKPGMLLRNTKGLFRPDNQLELATTGMGSGALFVDLNNTGRLDLFVSNCAHGKDGVTSTASYLFRNDGNGKFTDISKESGACLPMYAGRGLAAADIDGDGLIDLITCERYYGKVNHGPAILRNLGNHRFENISAKAGLPQGLSGLGVAAADLNNDGWPDLFFTEGSGEHRMYINTGKGQFTEFKAAREVFKWSPSSAEDTPAGVCIADVNGDGNPDIVIGHHYKAPWQKPEPVRLYLHQGHNQEGLWPTYKEVTQAAGLTPLAMKAPHVEIQDFDNDGKADIYVSIVKFKDGKPYPVIFRNEGNDEKGVPRFKEYSWSVNDFPNGEDLATKRTGAFFEKMLKDKKIMYMAAGPSCDYDRDGRLDLFLANWWLEDRSLLLRNETNSGNWLAVTLEGGNGINRMGIGATVMIYPAGTLSPEHKGDATLLAKREIQIGYGYCSGQEAAAHFGLGDRDSVDISVTIRGQKQLIQRMTVKANQRVHIRTNDER